MLSIHPLPYPLDAQAVFTRIRDLGDPVLLDSAQPESDLRFGRYDIIAAAPDVLVRYTRGRTEVRRQGLWNSIESDPVDLLKSLNNEIALGDNNGLPFCGGLIGHFSYDLGRAFEALSNPAEDDLELPEMRVGRYLWAIVIDHENRCSQLVCHPRADTRQVDAVHKLLLTEPVSDIQGNAEPAPFRLLSAFESNLPRPKYMAAFNRIQEYILAGDCYQINLTQRFSARCEGDPFHAYRALRKRATTPFSAYMESGSDAILSLSPERFLKVSDDGEVETRPIKGTRPRGSNEADDQAFIEELRQSEKDRSENLMIVDLLRNDLGKVCEAGSISVPELFAIETYPNVHHLVSAVTGQLAEGYTSLDLLKHCFPGGSITGAPKIRAMQIIDELEPHRRGVYCGSIGYISAAGGMDTSICIRTLLVENGRVYCSAGGGIVADSVGDEEYQESFDKVNNLLETLSELGKI
ncbi:aminodeoxychorismate synthase component I [Marinobacterium mangrovicola]|uniref:aminodeoxychorismate synthase n=1 Tax=Marinobacterium mangrovicola TaxID=1476959 RepID=A0A4R1GNR8_9GAMM|nr:aminodeoxychorismate synthase component I [Marinobacterium mangrovicola]TCK08923.1 aminodeoxychorismate synthase subunit I [Marinobacterium mangrovicola]